MRTHHRARTCHLHRSFRGPHVRMRGNVAVGLLTLASSDSGRARAGITSEPDVLVSHIWRHPLLTGGRACTCALYAYSRLERRHRPVVRACSHERRGRPYDSTCALPRRGYPSYWVDKFRAWAAHSIYLCESSRFTPTSSFAWTPRILVLSLVSTVNQYLPLQAALRVPYLCPHARKARQRRTTYTPGVLHRPGRASPNRIASTSLSHTPRTSLLTLALGCPRFRMPSRRVLGHESLPSVSFLSFARWSRPRVLGGRTVEL
ncbi:hypothetical protein B0H16DRAFT_782083 [Mycena metata]|uniref:Uncharacterized protein n=1 Tax=Mycena metata TaxID=1033252 RepID=A0AAD7N9Y0_9AGAR|nr:hypothetical protein B0H16DRAFT_782083 [Mycena metata]